MPTEAKHVARLVRLASATIGVIVATHTMLETARDTLFLERIPVADLPWMYLGVAALSMILAFTPPLRGANRWAALPLLLAGASVGTALFWALASVISHRLYYALYIWTALCGATVVTQFWTTAARVFTLGEAKRLFAKIAIGAVVGSAIGAGVARLLFLAFTARGLVLVAAIGFAASSVLSIFLRVPKQAMTATVTPPREELSAAGVIWKSPYLIAIGQLAIATAIAVTILDYAFKRALVQHFGNDIGPIVATVAFATNAVSGVIQIFFVPRILAAVGTVRSLRILPSLLSVGAVVGAFGPHILVVLGLRSIDGILRYSLSRTATELLFVPVSEAIRGRVKTLLDVVTQRGGQSVASLALLAVPIVLHTRVLLLGVAVSSFVWLFLAMRIQPRYLSLFRSMVQEGSLQSVDALQALDQTGVEVLVEALSNERDEEVMLALDVLTARGKAKLVPTLILFHPSARVVVRALEIFAATGRRDATSLAWRLVSHADSSVRTQAVHTACALDFGETRVRALLTHDDPLVVATALVELWARGAERQEEMARVDELLSPTGDPGAQTALLRALATTRSRRLLTAALPLAEHAGVDVKIEIAKAVEADPIPEAIGAILPMLGGWATRDPARRALVAIGAPALAELVRIVDDPSSPPPIRLHVPRSISRFPADTAVPLLLGLLNDHPEGVIRYKALRGLGRLASDGAMVRLDDDALGRIIQRDLDWTTHAMQWLARLSHTEEPSAPEAKNARQLLVDLLIEKLVHAIERVFRVIALRYRGENWERIFEGLRDLRRWDASRELLDGVLREPIRGRLLSLIDRGGEQRRAPPPTTRTEPLGPLLSELAAAEDHMVALVAAYYGRTNGMTLGPKTTEVQSAIRRVS
jgi:ATP:ADP antiporter, AAA family